jgi:hypothetical protein
MKPGARVMYGQRPVVGVELDPNLPAMRFFAQGGPVPGGG